MKFHDIGEAYEVLSDDDLKAKYDRGEQVFENQGGGGGGGGRHHFNAHQFFHQNFGGGGGTTFHFRHG
jgi:DnaJ-class molecular chaperone